MMGPSLPAALQVSGCDQGDSKRPDYFVGSSALAAACARGHVGTARILLARGAVVDSVDVRGSAPMLCTRRTVTLNFRIKTV